jgi:hypothetical protein
MTFAVFGPIPVNDCQLFAVPWRSRSASLSASTMSAALR